MSHDLVISTYSFGILQNIIVHNLSLKYPFFKISIQKLRSAIVRKVEVTMSTTLFLYNQILSDSGYVIYRGNRLQLKCHFIGMNATVSEMFIVDIKNFEHVSGYLT